MSETNGSPRSLLSEIHLLTVDDVNERLAELARERKLLLGLRKSLIKRDRQVACTEQRVPFQGDPPLRDTFQGPPRERS